MLKADLHIHTEYSMDCGTSLENLINRCLELGINCVAVADHGTIEGAVKLQSIAPFPVVIAEEILTPHGEIMGLFLKATIPSGLPVEEVVSEIKAQGGLVCIPHPFDTFRVSALDNKKIEKLVAQDQVDILEVLNSRAILQRNSTRAQIFAQKYDIVPSAGSDAHTLTEIGNAYVVMPGFNGKDDFLEALAKGKIYGHRTNPLIHFRSFGQRLMKKLR